MAQINLPSSYYMYGKLLGFKERQSILNVRISRLWWFNSNINVTVFKKNNIVTARKRSLGQGNFFTPICLSTRGKVRLRRGGSGQTLPEPDKGRYASYWNAFLFLVNSNHTNSQWLWKSCPFNAINVTLPITLRYLCSRLVNICRR